MQGWPCHKAFNFPYYISQISKTFKLFHNDLLDP